MNDYLQGQIAANHGKPLPNNATDEFIRGYNEELALIKRASIYHERVQLAVLGLYKGV